MDAKEHERKIKLGRIESLQKSSAWDELRSMFGEIEEKFWKRHIADLKLGKEFDQRKMDRALGMFDGIRDLLNAPVTAAKKLERLNASDEEETS